MDTEDLVFQNIPFRLYIPYGKCMPSPLKLLVVHHGTRKTPDQRDGASYMDIPLSYNDGMRFGLAIVSPMLPSEEEVPDGINGANFARFNGDYCTWLHDLVHTHLPKVFLQRNVKVDTKRFFLFGHSLGGSFVHRYIMTFKGADIHRAASCAGAVRRSDDSGLNNLSETAYLERLDAFIQTQVALIVGTNDRTCDNGDEAFLTSRCINDDGTTQDKWRRIKNPQQFICQEVLQRVAVSDFSRLVIAPPEWHPEGAVFACDIFAAATLPRPVISVPLRMAFRWTANTQGTSGHTGGQNYATAREFLFAGMAGRGIISSFLCSPSRTLSAYFNHGPKASRFERLERELADQMDLDIPIAVPDPPVPPVR